MENKPSRAGPGSPAPIVPQGPSDWYIARLKAGGLRRAVDNLERQGVSSLCPKRYRTLRRGGRLVTELRPLFPGYLFVQVPEGTASWRSINATYGLAQVICLEAGRPSRVPEDLMRALLAVESDASGVCPGDVFEPGEKVRVVVGPFADFLAKVESVPEKDRIFVLLDMMGRTIRTELSGGDLERL